MFALHSGKLYIHGSSLVGPPGDGDLDSHSMGSFFPWGSSRLESQLTVGESEEMLQTAALSGSWGLIFDVFPYAATKTQVCIFLHWHMLSGQKWRLWSAWLFGFLLFFWFWSGDCSLILAAFECFYWLKNPSYLVAFIGEVVLNNTNTHSKSRCNVFWKNNLSKLIEMTVWGMVRFFYIFDDFLNKLLGHNVKI